MTERKIVNKFYPHDFDPTKVYKRRKSTTRAVRVRTMVPFTVSCLKCGSYIYRGTKINAIKKKVFSFNYLGMLLYRFYMNCQVCNAVFHFRTNPQSGSYIIEKGIQHIIKKFKYTENKKLLIKNDCSISKRIQNNVLTSLLKI